MYFEAMRLCIGLVSMESGISKRRIFPRAVWLVLGIYHFSKELYAYLTVPVLFSTQHHRQINSYSSVNLIIVTTRAPEAISVYFFQKNPLKHNIFCLPKL
jgi:hypothetical protein